MPTLKQSTNIDRSRLAPVAASNNVARSVTPPPVASPTETVSSMLDSSLPTLAAGADIYTRQFYNRGGLPQRRFLPLVQR